MRNNLVSLLLLSVLMVSKVMYPRAAPVSVRTPGGIAVLAVLLAIVVGSILKPASILFPFFLAYASFGVLRHITLMLIDRGTEE